MGEEPSRRGPAWTHALLPSGRRLPCDAWRQRNKVLLVLLWAHAIGLAVVAIQRNFPLSDALLIFAFLGGAAVVAAQGFIRARLRACVAAVGLLSSSAILVHLTDGLTESHFHFFVMLAVITFYQDWLPFLLAVGFVVVYHGVLGVISGHSVYGNPAAQRSPVLWAFIYAGYVLAACAANIYTWRLVENEQARTDVAQDVRDDAIEASRLKSHFVATMSHEIRTPMSSVVGLAGLLLDTDLSKVQRHYAEGVEGAGAALLGIVDDILDFSKLEAGRVELELVELDLQRLLAEVADLLARTAHAKNLELVAYCHLDIPRSLRGDSVRIRQILINLVSNALKFTSAGEVVIEAKLVSEQPDEALIRFEVRDTGIGVDPAKAEHIFEPFSHEDASTTRRYGGTGLGLAICRRLVTAMHGRLGLDTEPHRGSTFWFEVPLTSSVRVGTEPAVLPRRPLQGLRVLVVDDNATCRRALAEQLAAWGAHTDQAVDGVTALALLRHAAARSESYALAVIDAEMPAMDGLTLARHISADVRLAATPLMLLMNGPGADEAPAKRVGVGVLLAKPVRTAEFYDGMISLLPDVDAAGRVDIPASASSVPVARPPMAGDGVVNGEVSAIRQQVLIVEDNAINQLVAKAILDKLGYRTHVVNSGMDAIEAVAGTEYAAVLMDVHMPQMNGLEATERIRLAEGANRHTPIIAMTASAQPGDRARCLEAGMDDYIMKPVDVASVKQRLAYWCSGKALVVAADSDLPSPP